MIYDRARNCYYEEKQFGGGFLRLLYSGMLKPVRPLFLREGFSDLAYSMVEKGYNARRIEKLMAAAGINGELFQGYPFESFTEFFLRRYKKEALPEVRTRDVISPSDGKVRTYQVTEDLKVRVKGRSYSLAELMGGSEAAKLFRGGRLFIIRLSLDDCHRFIYTENGFFSGRPFRKIKGLLHTVSSYSEKAAVLKENERRYSLLETTNGMVMVMEVGAMLVGRIRYHRAEQARRYAERGWFEPGGSTIVLMYQKDIIRPDLDLIQETLAGNEVRVRMGERIGTYL